MPEEPGTRNQEPGTRGNREPAGVVAAASDTRRVRRLKTPRAIEVEAGEDGRPLRVRLDGAWQAVELTRRPWRIDQQWWRPAQLSRVYYCVVPEDGPPLTLYRDLISGEWARQEYR